MKTFSVRFYRRLILVFLSLLILAPTAVAVRLGMKCGRLEKQLETVREEPVPRGTGMEETGPTVEPILYQTLYPDLYGTAQLPDRRVRAEDTVYLTFDGSPTANTQRILDILDQYGVKATFFVVGRTDDASLDLMREIVARGHTIGLRSYSESFQTIYSSVEAYLEDFDRIYRLVHETTGVKAEIFRFPAGSVNAYNSGIYQELIAEMLRRNFVFFDWDVTGEDTRVGGVTAQKVEEAVLREMDGKSRGIVMLHDSAGKGAVVDALPHILSELQEKGYGFQPLTAAVMPVIFSYKSAP